MQKIIFIQDYKEHNRGDIDSVSSNVAFGLVDKGIAKIYSDSIFKLFEKERKQAKSEAKARAKMLRRAPVDKMMRVDVAEEETKKGRYTTK